MSIKLTTIERVVSLLYDHGYGTRGKMVCNLALFPMRLGYSRNMEIPRAVFLFSILDNRWGLERLPETGVIVLNIVQFINSETGAQWGAKITKKNGIGWSPILFWTFALLYYHWVRDVKKLCSLWKIVINKKRNIYNIRWLTISNNSPISKVFHT